MAKWFRGLVFEPQSRLKRENQPFTQNGPGVSPTIMRPSSCEICSEGAINFPLAMNRKTGNMSNVRSPKNSREIP
jgi:hypothetical protein